MTGSSGMIGSYLKQSLESQGHLVVPLVRHSPTQPIEREWDPDNPAPALLAGCDALIHLAGASIAGRFTQKHRAAIRDSRVKPTRLLAKLAANERLPVMVSASAIGIYGENRGDAVLGETASLPTTPDFLSSVVQEWEAAALEARTPDTRVVTVRTGIVQSSTGGVLKLVKPLFWAGLGGPLGNGQAWRSWVALADLAKIYERALEDGALSGPLNAVAPTPVRENDYARTLASVMHRPDLFRVPRFALDLVLGPEATRQFALASQRVKAQVLEEAGFTFEFPDLRGALEAELGKA